MSLISRSFNRNRASLLATTMFATTALAGLGGIVGSVVLSPGVALAQACTPDAASNPLATTPIATTPVTETCVGN
jgi:TRAP-type mannitol/chloroaromatic compound transport system permease large subunit